MKLLKVIPIPDEDNIHWADETVVVLQDDDQTRRVRMSGLLSEEEAVMRIATMSEPRTEDKIGEKDPYPTKASPPTNKWLQENAPARCPECPAYEIKLPFPKAYRCYDTNGFRHKQATGDAAIAAWRCQHARCRECAIREWGSDDTEEEAE